MATLAKGVTFGATEQVTNTKLHNLIDLGSVTAIVNADCDANMALVDTKLATIITGSKLSGSALFNLASIPDTNNLIPLLNIPMTSLTSIAHENMPTLLLQSHVSALSMIHLASIPQDQQWHYQSLVSSLASGAFPIYDGSTNYVAKDPLESLGSAIFEYHGAVESNVADRGETQQSDLTTSGNSGIYRFLQMRAASYATMIVGRIRKVPNMNTVRVDARVWRAVGSQTPEVQVTIGSSSGSATGTATSTPTWMTFTVDISSEANGILTLTVEQRSSGGGNSLMGDIILTAQLP